MQKLTASVLIEFEDSPNAEERDDLFSLAQQAPWAFIDEVQGFSDVEVAVTGVQGGLHSRCMERCDRNASTGLGD